MTLKLNVERAAWREVAGEVVLLDLESSKYLAVNETGSTVWSLLEAGTTTEALVEALVTEFDVDRSVATRDVDAFVGTLRERGLLVES